MRFEAKVLARPRVDRVTTALFGRAIDPGILAGPAGLIATRQGLERLRGNLAGVVRLADLANLHGMPIAAETWDIIRREATQLPSDVPPEACRHFLSLLRHPGRLGPLLRDLHEATILERFVPEFHHARGLLQFNQYHKYTVDEHCLRAVECATEFMKDAGPMGRVYRSIATKHILHLALLIHDLGKGYLEDHRELGTQIAERTALRLGLAEREAETLRFLVQKHELMNHEAFHRDSEDEETVVRLAVQVGSPERLEMLYVLTACDLAAVGPGVWDDWKCDVVTRLFHRTMQYLAVESPATTAEEQLAARRRETAAGARFASQRTVVCRADRRLARGVSPCHHARQAAADLLLLHNRGATAAVADVRYMPETGVVQFTVGTSENAAPGVFHKLTGACTSEGLEIRSAQINTLADGLILDRFWVRDHDFAGEPPADRLRHVREALVQSIERPSHEAPRFRRTWQARGPSIALPAAPTRVTVDNTTSDGYSIVDIFTHDRTGLLYTITRTLFELDLSVWRAKIGTYLDQVVDVFYVTDRAGQKIGDDRHLDMVRQRLLEVLK